MEKEDINMFNKKPKVEVIDADKQFRKEKRKKEFKRKVNEALYWINENKEVLVIVIPAALTIAKMGTSLVKSLLKIVELSQEKKIKDLKIYDRSMGKYLDLKRPLTQKDMKIVLERRENGEKLSNILMDMNLLK